MIKLQDWQEHQIYEDMLASIELQKRASLIKSLGAEFSKDGNQYCYLYGTLPNDCVLGFGDTPNEAINNFYTNFYNQKAV